MIKSGEIFPNWYYSIPEDEMTVIRDSLRKRGDREGISLHKLFSSYTMGPFGYSISVDIANKRAIDNFITGLGIQIQTVLQTIPSWSINDLS